MGKNVSKKVVEISEGMLTKVADLVLFSIYFGFEASISGYSGVKPAGEKAINDASEINYSSIKSSLRYLKRKGFLQSAKEEFLLPKITDEGKRRLKALIPQYDSERFWDGRIYLITYDIPREKNYQRNILRDYLKRIGCGILQYSVWVTPYNPKVLIKEFVKKYDLDVGWVVVSSLGRDGTIGGMDLKNLMDRVYGLEDINRRYKEFIAGVESGVFSTKERVAFTFLSILKDDPQIPFELLPENWVGDKAYRVYLKKTE